MSRLLGLGRRYMSNVADVPNPIPASFLRGGTSKGVFISSKYLPRDRALWDEIFIKIMGSPDPYGRQLDGMGGGISSLSKICVVGPPEESQRGADVQYTFAQIGIKDALVDYSGNCGNLSSMIGIFALDEGICKPDSLKMTTEEGLALASVTSYNVNTEKLVKTTFPVQSLMKPTPLLNLPQFQMAGVPGLASKIELDILDPAGARTGSLLPTGSPIDTLEIDIPGNFRSQCDASLVDASNPSVLVHESSITSLVGTRVLDYSSLDVLAILEEIRRAGANRMGLPHTDQAQPKIAVLSPPENTKVSDVDIVVRALSMGVLHKAVPMTLGLCIGVSAGIPDSVAHGILRHSGKVNESPRYPLTRSIRISHPSGIVEVGADFESANLVKNAKVLRTGRRLMSGEIYW